MAQEPIYMAENRYSYLGRWKPPVATEYETEDPASQFELRVQSLFGEGQRHLQDEEYNLALDKFRDLMGLILKTAHPKMPVDPNSIPTFVFPKQVALIDTFAAKAADILKKTPVTDYQFPTAIFSSEPIVPADTATQLKGITDLGLQINSYHQAVRDNLEVAAVKVRDQDWTGALKLYQTALAQVPATDVATRASLTHDLAILSEKAGDKPQAMELAQTSTKLFSGAKIPEAEVQALDTASGIFTRAGNQAQAEQFTKQAVTIRSTTNLAPVLGAQLATAPSLKLIGDSPAITLRPTVGSLGAVSRAAGLALPHLPIAPLCKPPRALRCRSPPAQRPP